MSRIILLLLLLFLLYVSKKSSRNKIMPFNITRILKRDTGLLEVLLITEEEILYNLIFRPRLALAAAIIYPRRLVV